MALNRQLCVPTLGHWGGPGLGIRISAATAQPCPLPTLLWASVSPCIQSGAQVPNLSGSRAGA